MCERIVKEEECSGFDFDHLDEYIKRKNISYLASCAYSWEKTLVPEIEKCRLLCANCHILHTINQRIERSQKKWVQPKKRKYSRTKLDMKTAREIRKRKREETLNNYELGRCI